MALKWWMVRLAKCSSNARTIEAMVLTFWKTTNYIFIAISFLD